MGSERVLASISGCYCGVCCSLLGVVTGVVTGGYLSQGYFREESLFGPLGQFFADLVGLVIWAGLGGILGGILGAACGALVGVYFSGSDLREAPSPPTPGESPEAEIIRLEREIAELEQEKASLESPIEP